MASNRAQSQYLRIYTSGGADHYLFQNFYVNSDVSLASKTYSYFPFEWQGVSESSAVGEQTVSLVLPATTVAVTAFEAAFKSKHICELQAFEFDSRLGLTAPQAVQIRIGLFLGYVLRISGSFTELNVELGSSIAPVGAQIPPRTASNDLIGVPIQK